MTAEPLSVDPPVHARSFLFMADRRFTALFLALVLYAFFSSPTPDHPGLVEVVIGGLLIVAAALSGALAGLTTIKPELWNKSAWLLMFYGMTLPVLSGLIAGNGLTNMARDLIPFLFLLMPLFLTPPAMRDRDAARRWTAGGALLIGLVFSLRVVWPFWSGGQFAPFALTPADPFYLANAPTVLFAGFFLLGYGALCLYRSVSLAAHAKAGFCLAAALVPFAAMTAVGQRASLGYLALGFVVIMMAGFVKKPGRALWPAILAILLLTCAWPLVSEIVSSLAHKTALVGMNMRGAELRAVMDSFDGSFWAILFGKGWGASFSSPAVGGVTVIFTHSLLTAFWLKTGLFGLVLVVFYLFALGKTLYPLLFRNIVLAAALAGPFLIDIFLYASYKSLDFGLILLLIALYARPETGEDGVS